MNKGSASVSNLEAYRRYCAGLCSYDDLIKGIVHRTPNQKMIAGTELHKHIENGYVPQKFQTPCGLTVIMPDKEISLYAGNPEISGEWVSREGYCVRGRADAVDFETVYDHKLTSSGGYRDSFQWRLYLMIFNARLFIYNIFQCGDISNNQLFVRDFTTEEYTRYSGMDDECNDLVSDYMKFIHPTILEEKLNARKI